MNDIERYNFWNREMEDYLESIEEDRIKKVLRWDSVINKVPIKIDKPKKQNKLTRN